MKSTAILNVYKGASRFPLYCNFLQQQFSLKQLLQNCHATLFFFLFLFLFCSSGFSCRRSLLRRWAFLSQVIDHFIPFRVCFSHNHHSSYECPCFYTFTLILASLKRAFPSCRSSPLHLLFTPLFSSQSVLPFLCPSPSLPLLLLLLSSHHPLFPFALFLRSVPPLAVLAFRLIRSSALHSLFPTSLFLLHSFFLSSVLGSLLYHAFPSAFRFHLPPLPLYTFSLPPVLVPTSSLPLLPMF